MLKLKTMNKIQQKLIDKNSDFLEWEWSERPRENIILESNPWTTVETFKWMLSYLVFDGNLFDEKLIPLEELKSAELKPFLYKKPNVIDWDILNPEIWWEQTDKIREWYYPLKIVKWEVYRMPNHMHESSEEALYCAVQNNEWKWETRFFPKKNISNKTWAEAEELLL